jgi:hypothetical protein
LRGENRNLCPVCGKWFVVSDMLTYHLEKTYCGIAAKPKG